MKNLTIIIICSLFIGCAIAPLQKTAIRQSPFEVKNKSKSIAVGKLVDTVERGRVIGKAYVGARLGPACSSNGDLRWGRNQNITDFGDLVRNKLDKFGYSLVGKAYSPFNEEYSKQTHYLLGGKITDVQSNACYSAQGAKGEVFVKVDWEVFDTQVKSIVLSVTSEGYSSSAEFIITGDKELYDKAFDMAIDNLLAEKSFYNLLTDEQ